MPSLTYYKADRFYEHFSPRVTTSLLYLNITTELSTHATPTMSPTVLPLVPILVNMQRIMLHFLLLNLPLQVMSHIIFFATSGHDPWRIREHLVHFLERNALSLWKQKPEEERIGEVADDKYEIVTIANVRHCNGRDLADHRVESKRKHGSNRDTLGTCASVEHFGWDNPGQRTTGCGEGEIVQPSHDDETPMRTVVVGRWRELCE